MNGLKIGGVPEHFNYPWRLGIERGDFSEKGLRLHWSDMTGGTGQMIRGLETGSIDVAVLLTEGIVQAICNGLPAKIITGYVESSLTWGVHVSTNNENKKLKDFSGGKFAISRMGSGSHLMAYILAEEQAWKHSQVDFNVVGDVYGGLWAIENGEADFFLWEKYTTQPFVDQGKCARIATIDTPWPCFVIAAREDVLATRTEELKTMCAVIKKLVVEVMGNKYAYQDIAWRYHLEEEQTKKWFHETRWDNRTSFPAEVLEGVTNRLLHLGLLAHDNHYSIETMIKQMNA